MSQATNAASVALVDNGRVLLIQRARPPYAGLWTLPGGRLEPGETAEAAAAREVKEELGVDTFALRLVMQLTITDYLGEIFQTRPAPREFRLEVFATDTFDGHITPSAEIVAHRWIAGDGIGGLPLTPHLPQVIAAALAVFDRT
jgi:ADP-ribose pyrophosphatase YjhB (NUDIX family)